MSTEVNGNHNGNHLVIKVDVTLTRDQVRNYLGAQVINADEVPDKITVAIVRDLIRTAVQSHVITATMDWDLLATDGQIDMVDAALSRIMPNGVSNGSK